MDYNLKKFVETNNINELAEIFKHELEFFKHLADVTPYYKEGLSKLDKEYNRLELGRAGENNVSLITIFDTDMDKIDPFSKEIFPNTIDFISKINGRYRGSFGIMMPTCVVPWHTDHDEEDGFIEDNAINFMINISQVDKDKLPELHTKENTYKCKDYLAFDPSKLHSATNYSDKEWCFLGVRINSNVL